MERLAIDSSVAVKWFSQESDTDGAVEIRDAHVRGDLELIVSPLLYCEVVNALRFKPDLEVGRLERAVEALFKLHMAMEPVDQSIMERCVEIAFDGGVSIYDALPVAVAERNGTVCVTADEKTQYSRLKGKAPCKTP